MAPKRVCPGKVMAIVTVSSRWCCTAAFDSYIIGVTPDLQVKVRLDVLEEIPAQRKLVVLGEVSEPVGQQGPIYRALGERLARIATRVVVLGGSFQALAVGARRAGMPSEAVVHAGRSTARAVELLGAVGPGDVLLVKGRDTERLDRVTLALAGFEVECDIARCDAKLRCQVCPMLGASRGRGRVVP